MKIEVGDKLYYIKGSKIFPSLDLKKCGYEVIEISDTHVFTKETNITGISKDWIFGSNARFYVVKKVTKKYMIMIGIYKNEL